MISDKDIDIAYAVNEHIDACIMLFDNPSFDLSTTQAGNIVCCVWGNNNEILHRKLIDAQTKD